MNSIYHYATGGYYVTMLLADCITWCYCTPVSVMKDALESPRCLLIASHDIFALYFLWKDAMESTYTALIWYQLAI